MKNNTFSKASLIAHINMLQRHMVIARESLEKGEPKTQKQSQEALSNYVAAGQHVEIELFKLAEGIKAQVEDDCSIGSEKGSNQWNSQTNRSERYTSGRYSIGGADGGHPAPCRHGRGGTR